MKVGKSKNIKTKRNNFNNVKNQKKSSKGITLIALVITIIVLLILAGVSIATLTGENGILSQAQRAKEETENKSAEEENTLNEYENYINKALGVDTSEFGVLKESGEYVEEDRTVKDKNGDSITIPKGFKIAKDSGNSIVEGAVIEDDDIIDGGNGNQYVWIPITIDSNGDATTPYAETGTLSNGEQIKLSRYVFDEDGNEKDKTDQNISEYYTYGSYGTPFWQTVEQSEEIENYKASVAINGGYYIARYEASYGLDEIPNSKPSAKYSGDGTEGRLWNWIEQTDAITASKNIYQEINSNLINSYAWDTAILYIQKCSGITNYSRKTTQNTVLSNTGSNKDEACKINDLASNLREWTTESAYWKIAGGGYSLGVVIRGASYEHIDYYTSFRGENNNNYTILPTEAAEDVGFRVILYL